MEGDILNVVPSFWGQYVKDFLSEVWSINNTLSVGDKYYYTWVKYKREGYRKRGDWKLKVTKSSKRINKAFPSKFAPVANFCHAKLLPFYKYLKITKYDEIAEDEPQNIVHKQFLLWMGENKDHEEMHKTDFINHRKWIRDKITELYKTFERQQKSLRVAHELSKTVNKFQKNVHEVLMNIQIGSPHDLRSTDKELIITINKANCELNKYNEKLQMKSRAIEFPNDIEKLFLHIDSEAKQLVETIISNDNYITRSKELFTKWSENMELIVDFFQNLFEKHEMIKWNGSSMKNSYNFMKEIEQEYRFFWCDVLDLRR
jgi:hypothetical protein